MNYNDNLRHQAEPYRHRTRRKKLWHRIVSVLGCVVVFLTTYALILPAVTLDDSPICGYEEHRHDSSCYVMPDPVSQLSCSAAPHQHTPECADACDYADFFLHSHNSDRSESGHFVCKLPEIEAHTHDDSCYNEVVPTVCGIAESEGHAHGELCYTETTELTCTEPELEAHTHTDACFDEAGEPICGIVESQGHVHSEPCFTTVSTLTCEIPEAEGHTHGDACMGAAEKVLVCEKPEYLPHTHEDGCFDEDGVVICGCIELVEHIHSDSCLVSTEVAADPVLICEKTEHLHSDSCFPAPETTGSTLSTDPTLTTDVTDGTDPTDVTVSTEVTDPTDTTDPTEVTEPVLLELVEKVAVIYTDSTYTELSTDTTVITVTGLIPADAEVRAFPATISNAEAVLCAYDLTIYLPDGTVFEPAEGETLSVSIQAPDLSGDTYYPEVYYIPEEGDPELIDTIVTEDGVKFDTDHFSVYAVMAVDIEERIPNGAAGSYYHSSSLPLYQTSPFRVSDRDLLLNNVHTAETYVLVSVDEYGGKTWTPDSVNWTAAGNHNYVVAYCSDYEHYVSADGRTFYLYKIPLWNSKFNATQQAKLQAIIENSYPFITEAEMRARLEAAGYTGTFTASEMLCATQIAIWQVVSNDPPVVYDNQVPDNRNVLNPITTRGPGTERDVNNIINYLNNDASAADPGNLEVVNTVWTLNEDGSYSVSVELNRAVVEGETLNASLSNGSHTVSVSVEPGTDKFVIEWPAGLNEGTNITLTVSGSRTAFVVYYYDDGGRVQDLISGEYKTICMNYTEVLVRSTTDVTVEKKWVETDPSVRPSEITVYLTVNGQRMIKDGVSPVVLNESNSWRYAWSNLPTADRNGALIYDVEEIVPDGYTSKITSTTSGDKKVVTITNTQIPVECQTSLSVTKEWEDGYELHSGDSVTVHLYADGVYTGKSLVLSAENNWFGTFEPLPYYQEDGLTPIEYTIVEDEVKGYVPEYGEVSSSLPDSVNNWSEVSELKAGSVYRFVSNGLALSCGTDGSLIAAADNAEDPNQWWQAAAIDNCWILTNVGSDKSISFTSSGFAAGESGTILSFSNGLISNMPVEGDISYLQLCEGTVGSTTSASYATVFTTCQKNTLEKVPTYCITLTNRITPDYELPHTGSFGPELLTIGGFVLASAAWVFGICRKNKRETI